MIECPSAAKISWNRDSRVTIHPRRILQELLQLDGGFARFALSSEAFRPTHNVSACYSPFHPANGYECPSHRFHFSTAFTHWYDGVRRPTIAAFDRPFALPTGGTFARSQQATDPFSTLNL